MQLCSSTFDLLYSTEIMCTKWYYIMELSLPFWQQLEVPGWSKVIGDLASVLTSPCPPPNCPSDGVEVPGTANEHFSVSSLPPRFLSFPIANPRAYLFICAYTVLPPYFKIQCKRISHWSGPERVLLKCHSSSSISLSSLVPNYSPSLFFAVQVR